MIRLNKRIFLNGTYRTCYVVLLHEMCHQAAKEIDRVNDGHGKIWASWMSRCGLDPDRYMSEELSLDLLNEGTKSERNLIKHTQVLENPVEGDRVRFMSKENGLLRGTVEEVAPTYCRVLGDNGLRYAVPRSYIYQI